MTTPRSRPEEDALTPRQAPGLAERLGLRFRDPSLLSRALIHGSWQHEHPDDAIGHNERLEFLGDAVVSLVISEALHGRRPDDDEGALSARRAVIVSTSGLARLARRIDLGDHLLLGEGEAQRGGRARPVLLASAFEAVAAAVFLDQGWETVRSWLCDLAAPELAADAPPGSLKSPKSRLQELTQRGSGERPDYRLAEVSGPDHQRRFVVEVAVGGRITGAGSGGSRRSAETAAAVSALETLAAESGGGSGPAGRPTTPGPADLADPTA
ncbi:MAG: ribonuclease III [Chloroflexota bacterium]